ncbi:hypothetical protein PS051_02800 [Escherichia albertii]|nr:hypothetical protein [Escherichia albertii]MCU7267609.1 hypothetical protein [Escherichia albertii]MCU7275884.1 hypothetical protein [Escherichia albertii]MCU7285286.1 hypothetical protein [Escherichia albertii]MCU7292921.1 hypothetical protein [Escherichia albertii]MCU7303568.1 hypothetical protein [Escherichia albertii]
MSAFDVFNPTSKAGCGMVEKQLQALAVSNLCQSVDVLRLPG